MTIGNSKCKDPEMSVNLNCSRNMKSTTVAGAQPAKSHIRREENLDVVGDEGDSLRS